VSDDERFLQQFIQALTSRTEQEDAAALCSEAWIRTTGADQADIIQIGTPDTVVVDTCQRTGSGQCQHRRQELQAHFSRLLDDSFLSEIAIGDEASASRQLIDLQLPGAALRVTGLSAEVPGSRQQRWRESLTKATAELLQCSAAERHYFPAPRHLEAMAEFAAGAGHEINNPLGSILGQTAMLLRDESRVERRQALETIGGQGWRIRDMIGNTMLFARPPEPRPATIPLRETTEEITSVLRDDAQYANTEFDLQISPQDISVDADATQLSSLLSYLLRNSAEELRNSGIPGVVTLKIHQGTDRRAVSFSVSDTSRRRITPQERNHLFDPFFSGRSAGRGLGFGLSLAWQIVRRHQGILFAHAPDDGGLQTHVALPVHGNGSDNDA